ncbi:MAG: glycosyltransferase [Elusimicrobia bacterium]|nr:glycosyltransferase [Elusimicrobiota bacterium]
MSGFEIIHINGESGLRGGERQLLYLACALRRKGHRNVLAARAGSDISRQARSLGFETWELPFRGEWDLSTALTLRWRARGRGRTILHAHTGHGASMAAIAGAFGACPTVLHRRVDFPLSGSMSARWKYGSAGAVVAVSGAIKELLVAQGLAQEKVWVVPDGIPVDAEECSWVGTERGRFSPPSPAERTAFRDAISAEFNIPKRAAWVGNLAALVPHKDHDTLIAAAVIVLLKRPDTAFLIAGEGPEHGRLLEQIRRLGLLGRVFLLGRLPEPIPLLKSLDLFALSSWGEGMGSVLLEAAACGVPIAATTAGGIPEVIEHERSGLLASPRQPEALAANIVRLAEDPGLARRLAAAARADLGRFSLSRMAEAVENIYGELVA